MGTAEVYIRSLFLLLMSGIGKQVLLRLRKELDMIRLSPSPGVTAWSSDDDMRHIGR